MGVQHHPSGEQRLLFLSNSASASPDELSLHHGQHPTSLCGRTDRTAENRRDLQQAAKTAHRLCTTEPAWHLCYFTAKRRPAASLRTHLTLDIVCLFPCCLTSDKRHKAVKEYTNRLKYTFFHQNPNLQTTPPPKPQLPWHYWALNCHYVLLSTLETALTDCSQNYSTHCWYLLNNAVRSKLF